MKKTKTKNPNAPLFSPQGNTVPSAHPVPTKIPKRYLARTLHLNQDDGLRQRQINIKRIHIRKLIEADKEKNDDDNGNVKQLSTKHKICHRKKLFKGLTHIDMRSFYQLYWLEEFKHSKIAIYFRCDPYNDAPPTNISHYLQKMNKNLEQVILIIDFKLNVESSGLAKLYREVGKLRNLKRYKGIRGVYQNDNCFPRSEFLYLNKCLTRLPKLKDFKFLGFELGLEGIWKIMKEGKVYPKLTKLSMDFRLGPFPNKDGEEKAEDEVSPLFQFQTFPNLKELEIRAQRNYRDYSPAYGDFVVEGLKKLVGLEKLLLGVNSFSVGIVFVFEGLLHLPQLSSFSFEIDSMEPHNWDVLIQFLQNQANLVWIEIKVDNLEKQRLEGFIASLSYKPKLQYLTLKSIVWPLQILSNGFKRLIGSDQIKSFQLRTEGKLFSCPSAVLPSLQGLCEFLLRNKNTLYKFQIDFPSSKEPEPNDYFAKVISQLLHLEVFSFDMALIPDEVPLNQIQNLAQYNLWNLNFNKILPHLGKLENLTLKFDILKDSLPQHRKSMVSGFNVLPSLKNLRNFEFSLPERELSQAEVKTICSALKSLKCLNSIKFSNLDKRPEDYAVPDGFQEIKQVVVTLQGQQSLRMNLSF